MLNDEKLNYIENIQFLKIENKSLLERNNALAYEIEHQIKVGSSKK